VLPRLGWSRADFESHDFSDMWPAFGQFVFGSRNFDSSQHFKPVSAED
jgi:hypothetical protein